MDPRTILLVHGGVDVRRIYRVALEHARYRVLDTRNADDALQLLSQHRCDLVVTDLFVDGCDGDRCFVRRLRDDARGATLPVLVVTGWTTEPYRALAAREGATEFLPLPTLPRDLVARVNHYLMDGPIEEAS
jgi:DNA-binding response OmpR family regulator